jgi:hypothetical protein
MKNFIQYIDETYAVKVKELEAGEGGFILSGIDTPFIPISMFVDNKRVSGVDFGNVENLFALSILNDLGDTDLNTIPENHFFTAYTEVNLYIPFSEGNNSNVAVTNFTDLKQRRFVKKYTLPQLRHDNRFGSSSSYQYDSRLYSLMKLGTIQSQDKFYIDRHDPYKNDIDMDALLYEGQSPNNVPDAYLNVDATNLILNGGIVQYGDFFVKINKLSGTYPYGLAFFLWVDVRSNEFYPYIYHINAQSQNVKAEFDLSTLTAVAGGFKIKNILYNVELTVSTIYG